MNFISRESIWRQVSRAGDKNLYISRTSVWSYKCCSFLIGVPDNKVWNHILKALLAVWKVKPIMSHFKTLDSRDKMYWIILLFKILFLSERKTDSLWHLKQFIKKHTRQLQQRKEKGSLRTLEMEQSGKKISFSGH